MSDLFKIPVTQYWVYNCWIDAAGNPCDESTPGARFKNAYRVRKGLPGAKIIRTKSTKCYARINGKPIPLSANKGAARIMLGERLKKGELQRAGVDDPFELHRLKPLADHLADFRSVLLADGNTDKHARITFMRDTKIFEGCRFTFPHDVQASCLAEWLAGERKAGRLSITTSNYYLRDAKSFFTWMVVDRGLEWGHFRGLGGGHGELPGEVDGASTRRRGDAHWLVGSSPSRGIR